MNTSTGDRELIDWVQRQISTGARWIAVPGHLLTNASEEIIAGVNSVLVTGTPVSVSILQRALGMSEHWNRQPFAALRPAIQAKHLLYSSCVPIHSHRNRSPTKWPTVW